MDRPHIAVVVKIEGLAQSKYDMDELFAKGADLAELRPDYNPRLNWKTLNNVIEYSRTPTILTFRHKSEAGPDPQAGFKGSEKRRVKLQERVILEKGVNYLDSELSHPYAGERTDITKIIGSKHFFDRTPSEEELIQIYDQIVNGMGADIVKIVGTANSKEDTKRMINFIEYVNRNESKPVIGICMGELGKDTRLHPENYLTFVTLGQGKNTANGQLTLEEARKEFGLT